MNKVVLLKSKNGKAILMISSDFVNDTLLMYGINLITLGSFMIDKCADAGNEGEYHIVCVWEDVSMTSLKFTLEKYKKD